MHVVNLFLQMNCFSLALFFSFACLSLVLVQGGSSRPVSVQGMMNDDAFESKSLIFSDLLISSERKSYLELQLDDNRFHLCLEDKSFIDLEISREEPRLNHFDAQGFNLYLVRNGGLMSLYEGQPESFQNVPLAEDDTLLIVAQSSLTNVNVHQIFDANKGKHTSDVLNLLITQHQLVAFAFDLY